MTGETWSVCGRLIRDSTGVTASAPTVNSSCNNTLYTKYCLGNTVLVIPLQPRRDQEEPLGSASGDAAISIPCNSLMY